MNTIAEVVNEDIAQDEQRRKTGEIIPVRYAVGALDFVRSKAQKSRFSRSHCTKYIGSRIDQFGDVAESVSAQRLSKLAGLIFKQGDAYFKEHQNAFTDHVDYDQSLNGPSLILPSIQVYNFFDTLGGPDALIIPCLGEEVRMVAKQRGLSTAEFSLFKRKLYGRVESANGIFPSY